MDKRFHFKPYTFRGRLLLFLLLSALAACTLSAAGSFMVNISAQSTQIGTSEHEMAIYLLGLEQKTELDTAEMLAMTTNDSLKAEIVERPEWSLSQEEIQRLMQGEMVQETSGFTAMPTTYLYLREDIVSIFPSQNFNLFLSILPRVGFTLVLTMVLFALLSALVSYNISRPVTKLTKATSRIREGDFTVRLPEDKQGEMGELMRSFNSMTEALSRTAYLQKDFISSISHEFRTPIASIKGFARLLQMPDLPRDAQQEYIAMIAQESDRLSRLSDTILRLSALERQAVPASLSCFRLDEQIRQVILQLEPTWSQQNIEWDLSLDPVTIESDSELLIQVWINLIQNAVKFSPAGSTIGISVGKESTARVVITDHGDGMSEETLSHIFDRFYQGDRSRSKEGIGLGLCLVKRICDMLGASIKVRSTLGEGSTFCVTLPLRVTTKEVKHAGNEQPSGSHGR